MKGGGAERVGDFHDLEVYRRAYEVSLKLHHWLVGKRDEVADQLRRASKSIPANIAEGCSKANTALEAKRFLTIALRSVDEVKVWLEYCRDLKVLDQRQLEQAAEEYRQIGAMLYALWQRWRSSRDEGGKG